MQNGSFNDFLNYGKLNIFNEDALDFLQKLQNESIEMNTIIVQYDPVYKNIGGSPRISDIEKIVHNSLFYTK